nr:haloacid dehalogenase-like hydrolase domain-containing protein [Quercus suber]
MDVDEFQIAKLRAELLDTTRNWAEHSTFDGSWSQRIFSGGRKIGSIDITKLKVGNLDSQVMDPVFKGSKDVVIEERWGALPSALLFDCDGVLVDTEKDGHRISFNDTFKERELGVTWDVDLYGELLKIGGGKERMTAYFNKTGWPEKAPKSEEERKEFIASLHKRKTELFMALIEKKLLPLRPGVGKLIDQALDKGVKVAVCSTSNEKAVSAIVACLLGPERAGKIKIFAGDVVPRKKPDPAIYLLAASTLGVDPSSCVVVEDSAIGLAAAKAAGMKCIITKSGYTAEEDFLNADAVFDCIGDPPEERFDLVFCGSLLEKQYVS